MFVQIDFPGAGDCEKFHKVLAAPLPVPFQSPPWLRPGPFPKKDSLSELGVRAKSFPAKYLCCRFINLAFAASLLEFFRLRYALGF